MGTRQEPIGSLLAPYGSVVLRNRFLEASG